MSMKIKIILRKDADDFKGEMIAAHNRTKELKKNFPDAEIEVLMLREYFNSFFCKMRGVPQVLKRSSIKYDNITYKALWFNFSPIDNILVKLHCKPVMIFRKLNRFVQYLKDADIVIAHSTYAGYVAMLAKMRYGTPYTVTWHGTDIHTVPYSTEFMRNLTKQIIEKADANCFVSKDLMLKSETLTSRASKYVLYNGVDRSRFKPLSDIEIMETKAKFKISTTSKNIAFIGNLYPVKNVLVLPEIYKRVTLLSSSSSIVFHFVGDGVLRGELENRCKAVGIEYRMWGNQPAELIPSIINCMNMVVLPSLNEGLPLISVETLACGVPMIGSNVGGIAEAIGKENVVNLDDKFAENMTTLIVSKLARHTPVVVGDEFSWEKTGKIEKEILKSRIGKIREYED